MKNKLTVYILTAIVTIFGSLSVQAQQQKPSERSFTTEIKKLDQSKKLRDQKISHMQQQPAESTTDRRDGSSQQRAEQPATTKPSTGEMRKPQKPVAASKG